MPRYAVPRHSAPRYYASSPRPASSVRREVAWLDVQVPENAQVYINGFRTKSKGVSRRYGWKNLRQNQVVTCEVRAEVVRDGVTVEETKQTQLRAGTAASLAFDFGVTETSLTLKVPADAKVYLGDAEVKEMPGTGEVRAFTTTKLAPGQKLPYQIHVTVMRGGQLLSKQKKILLTAGDAQELVFDFTLDVESTDNAPVVAAQYPAVPPRAVAN